MTVKRTDKTLADYVAIALSPALIMALVTSLVFFLVAVLYRGEHAGRLDWILFFFVFGAVLIARIAMTSGISERAGAYGIVLGVLVWLGLLLYVDWKNAGPLAPYGWLIDIGLIAVTWWCAHRLTWDCTLIDDQVDASGAGLLQEAGLEKPAGAPADAGPEAAGQAAEEGAEKLPGLVGWWERYRRYRRQRAQRPHAPGVWVVYFSLAALPLFGLGQAILTADTSRPAKEAAELRNYTFWLMTVYIGSGLGLLLTTSFLGLRRYLRQRKLQMPAVVTGAWLTVGGLLAAALLLGGALLPRPDGQSRVLDRLVRLFQSPERNASDWDQMGDNAGKDGGKGTGKQPPGGKDKNNEGGPGKGQKSEKDGRAAGRDGKGGGRSERDSPQKGGQKDKSGKGGRGDQKKRDQNRGGGDKAREERGGNAGEEKKEDNRQTEKQDGQEAPPESIKPPEFSKDLANVLKWIVGGIAALVVLFLVLRSGLKFLANFTHWARRLLDALRAFWQGLWGGGGGGRGEEEEGAEEEEEPPRPFASYPDPFLTGAADRMTPEQLVRYTFEALQAWAYERGLARPPGETPLEFADRVGEETPALDAGARRLANLYAQVAYARGSLNRSCREPLRQFWQLLIAVVERPLSAGVGGE